MQVINWLELQPLLADVDALNARLCESQPVRSVCLACHSAQAQHKPGKDCSTCHLGNWAHHNG